VKRTKTLLAPALPEATGISLGHRLRGVVVMGLEEILAEVAPTLRRVRTLLLVTTVCIPLFTVGFIAALWHLGH
jgi:hypothetical protein